MADELDVETIIHNIVSVYSEIANDVKPKNTHLTTKISGINPICVNITWHVGEGDNRKLLRTSEFFVHDRPSVQFFSRILVQEFLCLKVALLEVADGANTDSESSTDTN